MEGDAILAISTAVVALVQLVKWAGIKDTYGPIAVLLFAAFGVALWVFTKGTFDRTLGFDYFTAWVTVSMAAAGVFGFTRAAAGAVSNVKSPPAGGAGQNPTVDGP